MERHDIHRINMHSVRLHKVTRVGCVERSAPKRAGAAAGTASGVALPAVQRGAPASRLRTLPGR